MPSTFKLSLCDHEFNDTDNLTFVNIRRKNFPSGYILDIYNITNAFKKAGICPLNSNMIAKEATASSALTAAPLAAPEANEARVAEIGEILEIPQPPKVPTTSRKKKDSRAKCLNEIET
ncbi:hypothetical protein HHI36_012455 [Cryptolaemus montrouzieri]|uniref:Uncharacterized protein n=1 Tax=Cryptolaemus montrouzieri TaxID=559131 RepID=A0ABD2NF13_9CUCU